ncbi:hypothetical protein HDU81_009400 [Chytriomyces hyalinus]|nr:hypothetical protein HDU81_009400 [Chytriomyces hyalinus]
MALELFVPIWSLAELEDCRSSCYPGISSELLKERYDIYGGVARYMFYCIPWKMKVVLSDTDAVKAIKLVGEPSQQYPETHALMHVLVGMAKYGLGYEVLGLDFASKYVGEMLWELHAPQMVMNLQDMLKAGSQEISRHLFEVYGHRVFSSGGVPLNCRNLMNGETSILMLETLGVRIPLGKDSLPRAPILQYYEHSGEDSCTAIRSLTSQEMFEFTTSECPTRKVEGLKDLWALYDQPKLYFVVPPHYFKAFARQEFVDENVQIEAIGKMEQFVLEQPVELEFIAKARLANKKSAPSYMDKQRLTQYQHSSKQILLDLSVKKSHVKAALDKLQAVDPAGAAAFAAHHSQLKIDTDPHRASILSGSLFGDEIPHPATSTTFPVSRQQMSESDIIVLRCISVLVASAFSVPVDPFCTHFLLHSLILIRRILFPSTPRTFLDPEMEAQVIELRQDPISLYLCALMVVECQLRDGQTSMLIWRKWLRHAFSNSTDTAHFDTVSAKLPTVRRIMLHALDHSILVSNNEYDSFLKVFRSCLSARNSRQFTASYAANPNLKIGGSEGFGVNQQHQQSNLHLSIHTNSAFGRNLAVPTPLRQAQSFNGVGFRRSPGAYIKSPLAAISKSGAAGNGTIYSNMVQVGSPLMEADSNDDDVGDKVAPVINLPSLFAGKRCMAEEYEGGAGIAQKRPFRGL